MRVSKEPSEFVDYVMLIDVGEPLTRTMWNVVRPRPRPRSFRLDSNIEKWEMGTDVNTRTHTYNKQDCT